MTTLEMPLAEEVVSEVFLSGELPAPAEEAGLLTLAIKLWRRGCCPEMAFIEQDWLSAEESVLAPH